MLPLPFRQPSHMAAEAQWCQMTLRLICMRHERPLRESPPAAATMPLSGDYRSAGSAEEAGGAGARGGVGVHAVRARAPVATRLPDARGWLPRPSCSWASSSSQFSGAA